MSDMDRRIKAMEKKGKAQDSGKSLISVTNIADALKDIAKDWSPLM